MRIEHYSAQELFRQLNDVDETANVEAKALSKDSSRSIMETVCSFSNEPGLGGGVILLGVAENDKAHGTPYVVEGIDDTDKAQLDFASQCATMFNFPVRPEIEVDKIDGRNVLKIFVPELPASRKPLYFPKDGLPRGIYRRIGSSDQRCTEDDLYVFYSREDAADSVPIDGTTLGDVDPEAVRLYKVLREKVRPDAAELVMETPELLRAIGCVDRQNPARLNLAGVLLFGTQSVQRQIVPAVRVDYIRVPGNEWVKDPERSFISTEMRGSLIAVLYRAMDAVRSDLPNGFLLKEDDIQAKSVGLPAGALREAIVNALMHRSYRVNRPTQIIRYDNRLEITNAGYSLKPEDELGETGSEVRNPILSDVFHDLNLAEQKGSGILRMKRMMEKAHLAIPTFESSREANKFTARLLLHHFLGEEDLKWLSRFERFSLSDNQKKALVFLRESGAVNNSVFRQFSGEDTLHASVALRELRDFGIIEQKGRGSATYYVPGQGFLQDNAETLQGNAKTLQGNTETLQARLQDLRARPAIAQALSRLKKHTKRCELERIIVDICNDEPLKSVELAGLLKRNETYLRGILSNMVGEKGPLSYVIPEMPTHPNQSYKVSQDGIFMRGYDRSLSAHEEEAKE